MLKNECQAGTNAQQSINVDVTTASQTIAKPHVGSSFCQLKSNIKKSIITHAFTCRIISDDLYTPLMAYPRITKVNKEYFTITYREFIPIEIGRGKPMSFALSKNCVMLDLPIKHFKKLNQLLNAALQRSVVIEI
jgi:hypothetical protein